MGDQGGPESQPLPRRAAAAGHRAPGPRRRAVGPSGPMRLPFAQGVLQHVHDSVMTLS